LLLEFRTFFQEEGRKPAAGPHNAEHTSAAEYAKMSIDDEYNSVARKRPEYNVFEAKNFSSMNWYLL
jgi:hypothetical protein